MRRLCYMAGVLCLLFANHIYAYPGCPESIENFYECQQYVENKVVTSFPKSFTRTGEKLTVKLSNGHTLTFKNAQPNASPEAYVDYALVKYFPDINYSVIYKQYYEGGSYDLIDMASGKVLEIWGNAELSPDKRRLAVFNWFEQRPLGFAIYLVTDNGLVQEFKSEELAMQAKWENATTIDVHLYDEVNGDRKAIAKLKDAIQGKKNEWEFEITTK